MWRTGLQRCRPLCVNRIAQVQHGPSAVHARYKSTQTESLAIDEGNNDFLDVQHLEHSPQLRSLLAGPSKRADVVVKRPTRFSKPGLARDLLQYLKDFPQALLLCRVGQFYESYFDQAVEIADLLKIRLTSKSMEGTRYPMCGFPVAQLDKFLEKLVRDSNRFVAICEEQREYSDAGVLKAITRKVVRVVTPGTLVDETFIEKSRHNYLLAADMKDTEMDAVELAWMDTSTGELFVQSTTLSKRTFLEDIARIAPSEIVLPPHFSKSQYSTHPLLLALKQLDTAPPVISFPHSGNSPTTGAQGSPEAFSAVPLLSTYIQETLLNQRPDLSHPLRVSTSSTMRLDHVSLRALEVKQNNEGGTSGTLLSVIDSTVTSAGERLLADRIASPSKSLIEIQARHALVGCFYADRRFRDDLSSLLRLLDDEARLLQKMSIGRPTAEDLLMFARAIKVQGQIRRQLDRELDAMPSLLVPDDAATLKNVTSDLQIFDDLAARIEASVDIKALEAQRTRDFAAELAASSATAEEVEQVEEDEGVDVWNIPFAVARGKTGKKQTMLEPMDLEPPLTKTRSSPISWGKTEATVLQPSSSPIIANLYKNIAKVENRAKRVYNELVKQVQVPTGELQLRVMPRFGPVVRIGWKKTHPPEMRDALSKLDDKGTLTLVRKTSQARYFTYNLWSKLNSEMQGLFVQLREAESVAIRDLCDEILTHWHALRANAHITAELDVATSLAKVADERNLVRPVMQESNTIDIAEGRHPVAESELAKRGSHFVSNDTVIDSSSLVHIITGPNMGGKSTVLRQVGLICIMAQAGSFVPATSARIGIVDQLFARIRYSDNIARGRSSFQVEMDDAAYILENASDRSLVLLDEFGRGTTADYASCIAESTIHALSTEVKARCLFATHLHDVHELIASSQKSEGGPIDFFCTRLSLEDSKTAESFRYLYKLVPGINRDAEAFTVAKSAGYPAHLLRRAQATYHKQREAI